MSADYRELSWLETQENRIRGELLKRPEIIHEHDAVRDFETGYLGPQNELEYIKEVEGSYDVIKDFEVGYLGPQVDPIVEMVRQDLLDRSRVGLKKYGVPLSRKDLNLRDWLTHALQECYDQALYLKRAITELDSPGAK